MKDDYREIDTDAIIRHGGERSRRITALKIEQA
jgi:hypothetical protein